jgi:hypothetical protein
VKLSEIAARISEHLKRKEASQPKNSAEPGDYYRACAWAAGSRVGVRYVSFQHETFLTKADALEYLAWLDAGNIGRHYKALSFDTRIAAARDTAP